MTREERALIYFKDLRERKVKDYSSVLNIAPKDSVVYEVVSAEIEIYDTVIKALEQEHCEDAISRQAVLDYIYNDLGLGDEENGKDVERQIELDSSYRYIKSLSPVTPQPKLGCEGCKFEKTGNNSTYPCSHCSRCYTDKYKADPEIEEGREV